MVRTKKLIYKKGTKKIMAHHILRKEHKLTFLGSLNPLAKKKSKEKKNSYTFV